MMKKILYLCLVFAATLGFVACSDDDNARTANISATGTVEDSEGNEYGWVRIGNLDWTTSNAKNGQYMGDLTYYDDIDGFKKIFNKSKH